MAVESGSAAWGSDSVDGGSSCAVGVEGTHACNLARISESEGDCGATVTGASGSSAGGGAGTGTASGSASCDVLVCDFGLC